MNDKPRQSKKYTMGIIIGVIVGIICAFGYFIIRPVYYWLNYDIKPIDVNYTEIEDVASFIYEDRVYTELEMHEYSAIPYSNMEKTCIGRIKGSSIVLYTLTNDLDQTIIIGETPVISVIVYSCKYNEIPTDGDVTGMYLYLSVPKESRGNRYQELVKDEYINEDVEKIQRIWDNRYKNEPIIFENRESIESPVGLLGAFCFEGCPVPPSKVQDHFVYQEGKWYFTEYKSYVEKGDYKYNYFGYLIDDPEIVEYLTNYVNSNIDGKLE